MSRAAISRRQARRQALFLLYQWDLSGQEVGSQYAGEIDPWARELAEAAAANAAELDERITAASQSWTADRLGAVERSALRIAITELDRGEVPAGVAIDEAVTFAKRYSSDEARQARQRHPGRDPAWEAVQMSADEALATPSSCWRASRTHGAARGDADPEQAIEILQELSELAKQVDAEIERARRAAEADAADA